MKTNENQKSTNSQPATQKPFFGAKPEQTFFSLTKEQSTPFFQRSATSKADVMGESVVQRMPAFESEVKDNRAVQRKFVNQSPIQAKLTIGEPGDKYEQEADRVASQVVEQINAPAPVQSNQGESVQRQEEKPEELQAKPEITTLQRQEEKPEELQAKFTLQRREDISSGEASPDLTSAINSARGGGQSLDAGLQRSMGQAMGADFSGVRVHTDTQSDLLNRSIQAKAFTTGQDVFFRQGAYEPGSRGGQELIAHELTHVVQQNVSTVQRSQTGKHFFEESNLTKPIDFTIRPSEILQRAIGVEFEVSSINTWKAKTPWGLNNALAHPVLRKRLKKGEALLKGPGYEMQADDDPNQPDVSDMEFVTDAFPDNLDGMADLDAALQGITNTCAAMVNQPSPLPVNQLPGQTLIGTGLVTTSTQQPHLPAGGILGKPQITIGVRLQDLSTFMEDVFKSGAPEALPTTTRLQPGRQALTGLQPGALPGNIATIVGGAPAKAHQAITSLQGLYANTPTETPALKSLLAMVIAYLDMGKALFAPNIPLVRSYAKTIAPIMARTDFAAMFNMLSDTEKKFYAPNNGAAWKLLVQRVPELTNLATPVFAQGIAIQLPNGGFSIDQSKNALSRQQWLEGMVNNIDYLTKYHFPTANQRSDIEGLGGYKAKMDSVANDQPAPIFELRTIPQNLHPTQVHSLVMSAFRYVNALNSGQNLKYGEA